MPNLYHKLYRFHVLLKVIDVHKSHLGETQIDYCLVVCWCLSNQKES